MDKQNELTEVEFWEGYWTGCSLPSTIDEGFSFERCLAKELKKNLAGSRGEIIEVGCAPGKWLTFAAKELRLKPSGIEYTKAGVETTLKNLDMLKVRYGKIWSGDFFKLTPGRFDVVMSLGFIEHFNNPDDVVKLHLEWLKPSGYLVLGVPNFRGVYRLIQSVLDSSVLEKHNTEIMNLEYFRGLAVKHGLEIKFLDYIGSFEPALPMFKEGKKNALQSMVKAFLGFMRRIRRIRATDSINSRLFSSYILAIYQRKA